MITTIIAMDTIASKMPSTIPQAFITISSFHLAGLPLFCIIQLIYITIKFFKYQDIF